jgi:hypothetical protein
VLDRAAHLAHGLITLDGALGAGQLLAPRAATGLLAHGLAHLVAHGGVTLPLTLRVAVAILSVAALWAACLLSHSCTNKTKHKYEYKSTVQCVFTYRSMFS